MLKKMDVFVLILVLLCHSPLYSDEEKKSDAATSASPAKCDLTPEEASVVEDSLQMRDMSAKTLATRTYQYKIRSASRSLTGSCKIRCPSPKPLTICSRRSGTMKSRRRFSRIWCVNFPEGISRRTP